MGYVEFPLTPVCRRLLIAFCIIETIMLCALALRIASRVVQRVKSYGEDILIVFAAVDVTAMLVLFGFLIKAGEGHPDSELVVNYTFRGKVLIAEAFLYIFGVVCARLGVFIFYLRVFPNQTFQLLTKGFMVISTCLVIANGLWGVFTCKPVSLSWDLTVTGECDDTMAPYAAATIVSIVSDVVSIILPLPLIWRLQMKRSNKISLTCLFAVGLSTASLASWRFYVLYHPTADLRAIIISAAALEIEMVIICSSVPIIYPLLLRKSQKLGGGRWEKFRQTKGPTSRVIRTFGSSTRQERNFDRLDSLMNSTVATYELDMASSRAVPGTGIGFTEEWSVVGTSKVDKLHVGDRSALQDA